MSGNEAYDQPPSRLDMDQELRSAVQMAHRINQDMIEIDSAENDNQQKPVEESIPLPPPQPVSVGCTMDRVLKNINTDFIRDRVVLLVALVFVLSAPTLFQKSDWLKKVLGAPCSWCSVLVKSALVVLFYTALKSSKILV